MINHRKYGNRYLWPVIVILTIIIVNPLNAQVSEYTLKALYIEHFATFSEWPESKEIANHNKPFVIGVYGKTNMLSALMKTYSTRKIMDKETSILQISDPEKFDNCHILFIGNLSDKDLNQTISILRNSPVLTVSENKGYAAKGVHINFYIMENNVRFEINEKAAQAAGLHISHHLLKLAKLVNTQ